jgi:lipopolysaccharide transport system ATP-binding protein
MTYEPVIRVEGLSKRYQLGTIGYGSLQHDLQAWWARVRGKEDPFSRVGEKDRKDLHGDFWALTNVGFTINQGDRVGVIGRNGAGKSTLLKLMSRVTAPTEGKIKVRGRVASLLEVGTGFHPELTGRENVFLNGAILGMKRREIQQKFDEIVAFAGVEQFIDTPVKRYSSGMYVKLAFSVAAHLDSEILIVDEVLAVGDATFQKKSLQKMEELSNKSGTTILYVSHNVSSLLSLCKTGILLNLGRCVAVGKIEDVVNLYRRDGLSSNGIYQSRVQQSKEAYIREVRFTSHGQAKSVFDKEEKLQVACVISINRPIPSFYITLEILDEHDYCILAVKSIRTHKLWLDEGILTGDYFLNTEIDLSQIANGKYRSKLLLIQPGVSVYDGENLEMELEVVGQAFQSVPGEGRERGVLVSPSHWKDVSSGRLT